MVACDQEHDTPADIMITITETGDTTAVCWQHFSQFCELFLARQRELDRVLNDQAAEPGASGGLVSAPPQATAGDVAGDPRGSDALPAGDVDESLAGPPPAQRWGDAMHRLIADEDLRIKVAQEYAKMAADGEPADDPLAALTPPETDSTG